MGTVFKALDRETGDIVALKELKPELRPHNDFFKRELLLARKVTHINVCRVFDLFRDEDRVFISMEYVDGESLADVIKRSGAMPVDQTMEIARQIIDGLEAAHRRRVIHRDLKPANIMIARDGTVKIMDFGLARSLEQTARIGSIAGTPAYMAPEQLNGELADARSDIYTLGVDIYEMLAGQPPSKLPDRLPAGVPEHVEAAIIRCLERARERRFGSVAELRQALTPKPTAVAAVYDRRKPRWTGFLVACLVIVVVLGIFSLRSVQTTPGVQSAPPPPPVASVPPVAPALPTVAVLIDGEIGDAFRGALIRKGKFRVLERAELEKVLTELQKNQAIEFDPLEAQRVGHLLGAQYLMFGRSHAEGGKVVISARLVRTETGEVARQEGAAGDAGARFSLVEQLVERLE